MVITVDFKPRNYASLAAHLEDELQESLEKVRIMTQEEDLDEYSIGLLRGYEKNVAVIKRVMADLYAVDVEDL